MTSWAGPSGQRRQRGVTSLAVLPTVVHALRRALEPDLPPGAESAFLLRHGESYRLLLGERDRWDGGDLLETARHLARAGVTNGAIAELERMEALCSGTFLP